MLNKYRVWIRQGPEKEDYKQFKDMAGLVEWLVEGEKPEVWGIEKYTDYNSWVNAFYEEDLLEMYILTRKKMLSLFQETADEFKKNDLPELVKGWVEDDDE
jgi:hypothetical protein